VKSNTLSRGIIPSDQHLPDSSRTTPPNRTTSTGLAVRRNTPDFVGAFPSVVLAVGQYTAIAKHEGKSYEHDFTVEPGLTRDIEVMAK